mmetsp:Transcript_10229/g.22092  ORF Transcript_10229/g.22092 Transcript_10229/m.22092 type:complete len:84 (+) Transcript_10229:750-1001(+)
MHGLYHAISTFQSAKKNFCVNRHNGLEIQSEKSVCSVCIGDDELMTSKYHILISAWSKVRHPMPDKEGSSGGISARVPSFERF